MYRCYLLQVQLFELLLILVASEYPNKTDSARLFRALGQHRTYFHWNHTRSDLFAYFVQSAIELRLLALPDAKRGTKNGNVDNGNNFCQILWSFFWWSDEVEGGQMKFIKSWILYQRFFNILWLFSLLTVQMRNTATFQFLLLNYHCSFYSIQNVQFK